jgi:hypothetical protein
MTLWQAYGSDWTNSALYGLLLAGEVAPEVLEDELHELPGEKDWRAEVSGQGVPPLADAHYAYLDRCTTAVFPALILKYGTDEDTESSLWFELMDKARSMGSYFYTYPRTETQDLALVVWRGLLVRAAIKHNLGVEEWSVGEFFVAEAWSIAAKLTGANPVPLSAPARE